MGIVDNEKLVDAKVFAEKFVGYIDRIRLDIVLMKSQHRLGGIHGFSHFYMPVPSFDNAAAK